MNNDGKTLTKEESAMENLLSIADDKMSMRMVAIGYSEVR